MYADLCETVPSEVTVYAFVTSTTVLLIAAGMPPITASAFDNVRARIEEHGPVSMVCRSCSLGELNTRYDHANRTGRK